VCRFHVAAGAELRLDRHHKQIVWSVAKPVSINLRKWFLSPTGSIKPWFHTERNLPMCSSYLSLGVPNWVAKHHQSMIQFRRTLLGETLQQWDTLKEMVDGIQLTEEKDRVKWKIGTSGQFRVKYLYLQMRAEGSFPQKFLWKTKIPMKVRFSFG
jgi:hypothetical protein